MMFAASAARLILASFDSRVCLQMIVIHDHLEHRPGGIVVERYELDFLADYFFFFEGVSEGMMIVGHSVLNTK